MGHLQRAITDITDGFHRGVNLLLHGWPYPRHLTLPAAPSDPSGPGSSR